MSRANGRTAAAAGAAGIALALASGRRRARRVELESHRRRGAADAGRPLRVSGPDGTRLHVRVHGPLDAPPLVLVHCWTGTQELWHKQIAELAGDYRIVVYDHRGHGLSEPAASGDYSLEALAADLDAVLDAALTPGERPVLAGHSMGAMTLAAWADRCTGPVSERISGAALLSTGLDELTRHARVVAPLPGPFETARGLVADTILEAPAPLRSSPYPLVRAGVRYAALTAHAAPEDVELTTRMLLDCRPRARAGCGRAMSRMNLAHAAEALDVPTAVVAGSLDRMTPVSHAERITAVLPHSLGLRVDPRAGHMTPLESPALVAAALRDAAAAGFATRPRTTAAV